MTKECFLRALQRHRERVIYAFGWAVVLLSPFLMMYFRSRNSSDPLPWGFYGAVWATMGVFLVFFLFHNRFVRRFSSDRARAATLSSHSYWYFCLACFSISLFPSSDHLLPRSGPVMR